MTTALSERLSSAALALPADGVSLQQLAALHGPAATGSLLILLAAPCLLPLPGVGSVLGMGLLAMALALWRGNTSESARLPQRVADFNLPSLWAARVLQLLARFYASSGRLTRPRLTHLSDGSSQRWLAAKAGLMAVLIVLPIPFGNLLPALALMLLGLGLVARDGVAILAGMAMALLSVLFSAAVACAAWFWGFELYGLAQQIPSWLMRHP
ncbi:exopolysaccharide biosynthesis protein [Roseateles oligotrophus]|uniref:Exopolysaccharide biosynthesis protein n=1 Tax=Roseateles oligotrophus TaxID=1769250 RepID=A0ABT2YI23_9BURK|nr:exopolysaccharide biosynthesis protein [Roseateles oligotrophus]MCV2369720.1 exopolysaccharide biosynthesis protein [Roseateles oligotrophus]